MGQHSGKVIIPSGADVWPHELACARTLATAGYTVEFLRRTSGDRVKSADIVMNGVAWEIKAPKTSNLKHLQLTLRRAAKQSPNVIIDSTRLHAIPDQSVEKELRRLKPLVRSVKRLLLVTKSRKVIDIR